VKKVKLLIAAFALACAHGAFAQRVEVRGIGTYQYEGGLFSSSKPSDAEKAKALASAKQNAWKNYVATLNAARQQVIGRNEAELLANLDGFVSDVVLVDAVKDPETKTLRVVARIAINDEAVNQALARLSVGDGQKSGARSQGSMFAFLFTARRATSITQFDTRRTDVREVDALQTRAADGGVNKQLVVKSGGSNLKKEDAVTYAVSSSQDLDTAVGEVLTVSGIEYVAYDDIVSTCNGLPPKKIQDEFVNADELSPATRNAAINAARECGVRYFAYGTLDSEVATTDPVTGSLKVFVSVRAQLLDISARLPRRIGSVGPKQFAGLGPNQTVASRNALALAARDLGKTLVDQLNAKGIR
jgi:hypothetical protein